MKDDKNFQDEILSDDELEKVSGWFVTLKGIGRVTDDGEVIIKDIFGNETRYYPNR